MTYTTPRRAGITLLEVVIALAIFLMSLVAIFQLVSFGSDRSTDVKMQSRASMLCQRELNKRIAGVEPLSGNSTTLSADDSAWQCDVEVSDAEITGLKRVKVTVKRELDGGRVAEASLVQLVLDPSLRGSTHDVPSGALSTPSTTEEGTDAAAQGNTNTGNNNAGGNNSGGNKSAGGNQKSGGGNTKSGNTKSGNTGGGPRGGPGGNTGGAPGGGFGPGRPGGGSSPGGGSPPGGGFAPGGNTGGFGPGGGKGKGP